jgi:hypothetical protein
MGIPPAVPLNWLSRAKIRIAPIDDRVVADEQKTIDLYFRSGLIKQKLDAAAIVDRSFAGAIGKAPAFRTLTAAIGVIAGIGRALFDDQSFILSSSALRERRCFRPANKEIM